MTQDVFGDAFDGEWLGGADEAHHRDGLGADRHSDPGEVAHFARDGQNLAHSGDEILKGQNCEEDKPMLDLMSYDQQKPLLALFFAFVRAG